MPNDSKLTDAAVEVVVRFGGGGDHEARFHPQLDEAATETVFALLKGGASLRTALTVVALEQAADR